MEVEKKVILYVDDERVNLDLFRINFLKEYEVKTALSAKEGQSILNETKIDVIISDLRMPDKNGLDFIKDIKEKDPDKVCIILSAYIEPDIMYNKAYSGLVYKFVSKPWKKQDLKKILEDAFALINDPV